MVYWSQVEVKRRDTEMILHFRSACVEFGQYKVYEDFDRSEGRYYYVFEFGKGTKHVSRVCKPTYYDMFMLLLSVRRYKDTPEFSLFFNKVRQATDIDFHSAAKPRLEELYTMLEEE